MKFILTVLVLLTSVSVYAQAPAFAFQKTLGGLNIDNATAIQQTSDGGYIIAGNSLSTEGDITGNKGNHDLWIVKLNASYGIQWQKNLGGSSYDYASSIQQTTDGGYIIAGYTFSNDGDVSGNHGGFDYWIIKLNSTGTILLKKCLGGTGQDFATAAQQTFDGGFIVAGYTDSNNGDVTVNKGGYDYWIVKLNSTGTIVWQKSFGGSAMDFATSVKQTSDSGYIVAGYTGSNNQDVSGNKGGDDFWIIKLTKTGVLTWQKAYGGSGDDMANSVQIIPGGGYIVAGTYQNPDGNITGTRKNDYWVIKLSTTGVLLWQKGLGGKKDDVAYSVQNTSDGGFLIAGSAESVDGDVTGNNGNGDFWIVKLKSNSDLLWQKSLGGSKTDIARSAQQTSDGGYIITGSTESTDGNVSGFHGANSFVNNSDYWLAKLSKESDLIISAAPGTIICKGTKVTCSASLFTPVSNPVYQWKKNGVNVGTNSSSYEDSLLNNSDSVRCIVTTIGNTLNSNTLTFIVNNKLVPSVSITSSPSAAVCFGTKFTFTATAVNGGENPAYQWKKNGINTGINSSVYNDSLVNNNDSIWCVLTTSESCVTKTTATSNKVIASIVTKTPTISITASKTTTCPQENVTFTASINNGGAAPVYLWKRNGITVGTNSPSFSGVFGNQDSVWCILTSNDVCLTTNGVTSNKIKITVNPNLVVSVSIASSLSSPICAGSTVVFTASAVNGGTAPIYQWKKNGVNVGTNSPTYTTSSLINNDTIYCELTSNACTLVPVKTSNKIRFTVNPLITPTISVSASTGENTCVGTKVTFSVSTTNTGMTPTYQWKKNGNNVGTNSRTYVDSTLITGDAVKCSLLSSMSCLSTSGPVMSNTLNMTVNAVSAPTITVVPNTSTTVCQGVLPTLTATISNGGNSPLYVWKKNSVTVGTNSPTYTPTNLINNDTIWCELTSSSSCATPSTVKSSRIRFTVNPYVTSSVSISANSGTTICNGTKVTFTATAVNGGSVPNYQWKKNGINVGTNAKTYSDTALQTSDTVYCVVTSTASCVSNVVSTSNKIVFTVNPVLKPTITITADNSTTVCNGTKVKFTASITNGGSSPVYAWKKNGVAVGSNASTYTDSTLKTNDTVYCNLTSNLPCPSPVTVGSNKLRFTIITIPANPSSITGPTSVTANQKAIIYTISLVSGVTNTWTVPSGVTIVSGQGNATLKVNWGTSSGAISVRSSNSCGNSIGTSSINVAVSGALKNNNFSTSDAILKTDWTVYPNPTRDIAILSIASATEHKYEVEITDAIGKVLFKQSGIAPKGKSTIQINLRNYAAGMYYIRCNEADKNVLISRIIKSE